MGASFFVEDVGIEVHALRVVHISGHTSCSSDKRSNWGCNPEDDGLAILIYGSDGDLKWPSESTSGFSWNCYNNDCGTCLGRGEQNWYLTSLHISKNTEKTLQQI